MSPRATWTSLLAAVALAAALSPRAAAASAADAFEGKIQPVSGKLFQTGGRLELSLGGGLSLNDAFFQKRQGDLKLGWHFTDAWYAGVQASGGAAVATSSTTVCPTGAGCHPASEAQLRQVPGRLHTILGVEAGWSPIYGKLNTFSEKVAHIDLSAVAGIDRFGYDEVLSSADAVAGRTPASLTSWGGHFGVALRVFLAEAVALRLDLRDYVYGVKVPNGPAGANGTDVQSQLFAQVGVSVFFPFERRQP
jgi:outer membrane beta-barrel protein